MQIHAFEAAPRLLIAVISHESFCESKNRTSQVFIREVEFEILYSLFISGYLPIL